MVWISTSETFQLVLNLLLSSKECLKQVYWRKRYSYSWRTWDPSPFWMANYLRRTYCCSSKIFWFDHSHCHTQFPVPRILEFLHEKVRDFWKRKLLYPKANRKGVIIEDNDSNLSDMRKSLKSGMFTLADMQLDELSSGDSDEEDDEWLFSKVLWHRGTLHARSFPIWQLS